MGFNFVEIVCDWGLNHRVHVKNKPLILRPEI